MASSRPSYIMAHRQTTRDGLPTQRQTPAALEAGMDCRNPLRCVRDYNFQPTTDLYEDAHRVADETVTFLRSFSKRLRRFEAQTGEFAQDPGPPPGATTGCGTHDPRPAKVPTVTTPKQDPIEPNHATGEEVSARRRTPQTPKYRVSPPDTTTSDPQSISMENGMKHLIADLRECGMMSPTLGPRLKMNYHEQAVA